MNPGKIENNTAAGRLYRLLKEHAGREFDALFLSNAIGTTCLSTRVSEVRNQVPAGERIVSRRVREDGRMRWYYSLVIDRAKVAA